MSRDGRNIKRHLVKSDVAGGATNTIRPLTHSLDLTKEGLAVDATHEQEVWRPVVGFEGSYEVSSLGRVRSIDRHVPNGPGRMQYWRGRVLKASPTNRGAGRAPKYLNVALRLAGKSYHVQVHHLVLEAFVGPRPPGLECLHANDIGTDNRVENLRWGTGSENVCEMVKNGLHHLAKRTHCKFGHEFTPDNTVYRKTGWGVYRRCRECRRREHRQAKRRQRESA